MKDLSQSIVIWKIFLKNLRLDLKNWVRLGFLFDSGIFLRKEIILMTSLSQSVAIWKIFLKNLRLDLKN